MSFQNHLNNNHNVPLRPVRSSNAGISIKDIFGPNGGPTYGASGQVNQGYEHVEDEDGNSMRLTPRNQVTWNSGNQTSNQRL